MPSPRENPLRFVPRGVVDSVNGDNSAPGSMTALTNLIPDPSTPGVFVCRPANTQESDFTGFSTPGIVSAAFSLNGIIYGMVATASPASKDRPFAYNVASNTFQTIAGVVSAKLPTTPSSSGEWTPPTMDALGTKIIVTHPGFNYAGGFAFGYFDISGFAASITGDTHSGTKVIDNVVSTVGLSIGYLITGTDIPADTYITNFTASTVTISANMTGSNTAVSLAVAGGGTTTPLWAAGNTSGATQLAGVPQAVKQFSNRAYFAQKNNLLYTDTLSLNVSNADGVQVLTVGDTADITALAGLPEYTSSTGVLQALLAFKEFSIWQVTGDSALDSLALNNLIGTVGTSAPRSVQVTPRGVEFMALDGMRLVDLSGAVSEVNPDLATPFIYTQYPSRVAAAFNAGVYRICVKNTATLNSPREDYHYEYKREGWTGPHTFGYDLAVPFENDFIVFSNDLPGTMWRAYSVQNRGGTGNTFIEHGVQMTWLYQTTNLTDVGNMYANTVIRTTIEMALPASGDTYNFLALDESASVLAQATIFTAFSEAIWNAFNWGDGTLWGTKLAGLKPISIPWTEPPIFNRMAVQGAGDSALGLRLGAVYNGYERLRYLTQS